MDRNQGLDVQLRTALPDLTRAERQLATHILSHYPVAALGSITVLAKQALDPVANGRSIECFEPRCTCLAALGIAGGEDVKRFGMGEVEPAQTCQQKLAADRRHGVIHLH